METTCKLTYNNGANVISSRFSTLRYAKVKLSGKQFVEMISIEIDSRKKKRRQRTKKKKKKKKNETSPPPPIFLGIFLISLLKKFSSWK
jgi:hypothetical protein